MFISGATFDAHFQTRKEVKRKALLALSYFFITSFLNCSFNCTECEIYDPCLKYSHQACDSEAVCNKQKLYSSVYFFFLL